MLKSPCSCTLTGIRKVWSTCHCSWLRIMHYQPCFDHGWRVHCIAGMQQSSQPPLQQQASYPALSAGFPGQAVKGGPPPPPPPPQAAKALMQSLPGTYGVGSPVFGARCTFGSGLVCSDASIRPQRAVAGALAA